MLIGGINLITRFAKNGKISSNWVLIPASLVMIFVATFFLLVAYDSSGFTRFIFISALKIMTVISVIIAIIQGVRHRHDFGRNTLILYYLSVFLATISSGIGFLGADVIINSCENSHLATGNIIVDSLENYYSENEQYPQNLLALIPKYIPKDSITTCYSIDFLRNKLFTPQFDGFYYKKCPKGTTQLSIPEMGSGHFHIYDLNNKEWYTSSGDTLGEWDRVPNCQPHQ